MKYCPKDNIFLSQDGPLAMGVIPHVMWHITDICPLACPYCFAPKTETGLPGEFIEQIAEKLLALGVQKVDISGGEPLAYDFLEEVCINLWSRGIHTTLTTSGVGKQKNKNFLISNSNRFARLIFSLDGYGDDHDNIRRKTGAWNNALSLIRMIDASSRKNICRINTVVTKQYYENKWTRKLGPSVDAMGVKEWCLIQPHPANQKDQYIEYALEHRDFQSVVDDSRQLISSTEIITRDNSLYSTYWNIQPNGFLQQHTDGKDDRKKISLLSNDIDLVKQMIAQSTTFVPT